MVIDGRERLQHVPAGIGKVGCDWLAGSETETNNRKTDRPGAFLACRLCSGQSQLLWNRQSPSVVRTPPTFEAPIYFLQSNRNFRLQPSGHHQSLFLRVDVPEAINYRCVRSRRLAE